jgi:hypothetical protein
MWYNGNAQKQGIDAILVVLPFVVPYIAHVNASVGLKII